MCIIKDAFGCKHTLKKKEYPNIVIGYPELDYQIVVKIVFDIIKKDPSIIGKFPDKLGQNVPMKDIDAFIGRDNADLFKYMKNIFDCDDFSAILFGRVKETYGSCNFGEIMLTTHDGTKHAMNFFVDLEVKKLWLVEPQTDIWELYDGQVVHYIRM